MNSCYRYAKEVIGATGFKNERWTAAGWVIPFFNLFKPYQIINEIYKAGAPTYAIPDGWKKESGSGHLLTWWIFWAVTHVIGVIVGKQLFKDSMRVDMSLQQSIGLIEFHAWFCVMYLIIAVLWFVVAGSLTRRLLDRQHAGVGSPFPGRFETVRQPVPSTRLPTLSRITSAQDATMHNPEEANQHQAQMQASTSDYVQVDEDTIYATVAEELETGKTDKGLWTRLFAECGGDEKQVKVLYIKRRAERLMATEKARREQMDRERAERERSALLEQERIKTQAGRQIQEAILNFQTGLAPGSADIKLLASAAIQDAKVALITDHAGNNLLHWCALLDLYQEAVALLRHGADAVAPNGDGHQPYQLAHDYALNTLLKAAANKPKGMCPNCATVMPLTSQICPKCSAIFEEGAAWKLVPIKNA